MSILIFGRKLSRAEYDSLKSNETWELAELPHGRNAIGSKWVFKHKRDADGKIHKCKARLVAKGYSQISGVDYDEVFSPVVKYNSIRTLLALVNQHDLEVHQMDVKTAYLNGNLEEELFMKQPEGFVDKSQPELVCKLKKSLYGLKQSARCWNKTIDDYLKKSGWVQNDADPCIYIKRFWTNDQERIIIAALYVDDLLIASNDIDALNKEKDSLSTRFEMVDEGEVHYILGMRVKRNRKEGVLSIDQQAFLLSTLKRFGMQDCKPVATPFEPGTNFEKLSENDDVVELRNYQSAIGCLTYLSIGTRPDIAASVGVLSQHV